MIPKITPVKNPKINAKLLKDWQYDAMYKQQAIAIPAITQFILDEVLRTIRAANGIAKAFNYNKIYLP